MGSAPNADVVNIVDSRKDETATYAVDVEGVNVTSGDGPGGKDETVASAVDVAGADVMSGDEPQRRQPEDKICGGNVPPAHGGKKGQLGAEPPMAD